MTVMDHHRFFLFMNISDHLDLSFLSLEDKTAKNSNKMAISGSSYTLALWEPYENIWLYLHSGTLGTL